MQIFKRFILYILAILLLVTAVSAALLLPWLATPTDYHDQALREKLAGSLDTLIIGQSYSLDGIMPAKLDKHLGWRTYNLCGSMMPIYGQTFMIEKEMARNPVKNIIVELTPDTFTSDEAKTYGNGDSYVFARLDSLPERLAYLTHCVQPDDWVSVYARCMLLSMRSLVNRLTGKLEVIDETLMGFNPTKPVDVSLPPDEARPLYNMMLIFSNVQDENIRRFEQLMDVCARDGRNVIVIYTPVSHGKVWQLGDQDEFHAWATEFCQRYGAPFFDFNLLKSRYELFSDETSFSDVSHLNAEGAAVFSDKMGEILARYTAGGDVSDAFFGSYEEMIDASPYWAR